MKYASINEAPNDEIGAETEAELSNGKGYLNLQITSAIFQKNNNWRYLNE